MIALSSLKTISWDIGNGATYREQRTPLIDPALTLVDKPQLETAKAVSSESKS